MSGTGHLHGTHGTGVRWAGLVRLALVAGIWGSSFLWIKIALRGFTPLEVALIRIALGAAVLVAIARIRHIGMPRGRRTWFHLTIAGFFQNALPYALFAFGEETVDSTVAGVINATTPLWTLLLALMLGSTKRLAPAQVLGLFLGFAGVVVILAPWHSAGAFGTGAALIMLAAFSYAVSYLYLDRHLSGSGIDPIALTGAQLTTAAALLTVALPFSGDLTVDPRPDAFGAIAVLGVLGTGYALVLNYRMIVEDGAAVASSVTYLLPPVSVLLGALVLGEEFGVRMALGIAVVLGGIALTRRTGKGTSEPAESPEAPESSESLASSDTESAEADAATAPESPAVLVGARTAAARH